MCPENNILKKQPIGMAMLKKRLKERKIERKGRQNEKIREKSKASFSDLNCIFSFNGEWHKMSKVKCNKKIKQIFRRRQKKTFLFIQKGKKSLLLSYPNYSLSLFILN